MKKITCTGNRYFRCQDCNNIYEGSSLTRGGHATAHCDHSQNNVDLYEFRQIADGEYLYLSVLDLAQLDPGSIDWSHEWRESNPFKVVSEQVLQLHKQLFERKEA
jgi:hypothetical protein